MSAIGVVYQSSNAGVTWNKTSEFTQLSLLDMSRDNSSTLSVLGYYMLYRSTDAGISWSQFLMPTDQGYPKRLAVDPTDGNKIYAVSSPYDFQSGGYKICLFKSADGGVTWGVSVLPQTFPYYCEVTGLAVSKSNPSTAYICGIKYSGTNYRGVLLKSQDSGATWVDISDRVDNYDGRYHLCVAIDPTDAQRVYVGGNVNVCMTTDGGETWPRKTSMTAYCLSIDPLAPQKVYVGSGQWIYASSNRGDTWSIRGYPTIKGTCTSIETIAGTGILYVSTNVGLYRSTDSGSTWSTAHNGIANSHIGAMALAPSKPERLLIAQTGAGIFGTDDSGLTWAQKGSFDGCTSDVVDLLFCTDDPQIALAQKGFG